MKSEVKALFVEALRSGRFKQGKGALHTVSRDGEETFCCLGVLTRLAVEAGVLGSSYSPDYGWFTGAQFVGRQMCVGYEGRWAVPPPSVRYWSELALAEVDALGHLNDSKGKSFNEIADWVEEYL